ncbi:MAG TPA: lipid-binding SYLF domain-containing protein [Terriglobales bacterium]|nr:lipid-binding SYLF domain-containing protein [Terriglobales bacterium]
MKRLMLFLAVVLMASLAWAQSNTQSTTETTTTTTTHKKAAAATDQNTGETPAEKHSQNRTKADDRLQNAAQVLQQVMGTPDKGIPEEILKSAKCIAVVPHMIKGGFVFGAENGKGVATCRLPNGNWSAPAFFTITGGSWGLQIGAEGVDLVMMIMNDKGMQQMLSAKFRIGAEASAAAGPVGRHASAGTDYKLDTQILTYSRSKGAFAGATLEGSDIRPDKDSTRAIYGRDYTPRAILTGKVRPPAAARSFLAAVRGAKVQAKNKS